MAFINEYISEEDIEKYDLKKLIEKYKRYNSSPRLDDIEWTIDKENDIWLIFFGREHDPKMDHGFTKEHIFILYYKGKYIEARLWGEVNGSLKNLSNPFFVDWKLLSLSPNSFKNLDTEIIKQVLCDALKIYGRFGMFDQRHEGLVESLVVSCTNFEECCK